MAQRFSSSQVTLTAATAHRLSDLLAAEGYTGRMLGKYLQIHSGALADLFQGDSSAVSATNGVPIPVAAPCIREAGSPELAVDPGSIWLFSTGGGDVRVIFEPF
jgi:hypothetical protein